MLNIKRLLIPLTAVASLVGCSPAFAQFMSSGGNIDGNGNITYIGSSTMTGKLLGNGNFTVVGLTPFNITSPSNGQCLVYSVGSLAWINSSCGGGGGGSVTSVALTTPSWLTVAGSPITTSGTLAVTATTGQTANSVLASPNGSTGALSVRALVAADIPTISLTTGVSGILPGSNGGTNNAFFSVTGPTTPGKVFTFPDISTVVLTTAAPVTVGQGGTGLTAGATGGIPYFSSTSAMGTTATLGLHCPVIGQGPGNAPITDTDFQWDDAANILTIGSAATPGTIAPLTNVGGAAAGATLTVSGGTPDTTFIGGALILQGGPGGSTSGNGAGVQLLGGTPTVGNGGGVTITGAAATASGTRTGGSVTISAGAGFRSTAGSSNGNVTVSAGSSAGTNGLGGTITLTAGAGAGAGGGGSVSLSGGTAGATGSGGTLGFNGGIGGATSGNGGDANFNGGTANEGNGGGINFTARPGVTASATARNGGSITLTAGAGVSGGLNGTINLAGGALAKGTTFTASGCSVSALVGGANAGQFASGTTGACTVVITPGVTAPNGWYCRANNLTTTANAIIQSASTTTTCTVTGTTVSADTINFLAIGY